MRWKLAAFIGIGFLIGGLSAVLLRGSDGWPGAGVSAITSGKALIGGPFSLIDHDGKAVTEASYAGSYLLVYFGFTACPDICPSGLQVMSEALDRLGDKARRVTPLFITVDPERDTAEQLKAYISSFHSSLVGLTGTPEQIATAAKAYRIYYARVDDGGGGYTMDHSAIFYLMGPDGQFLTHFAHTTSVDKMAETLAQHVR